MPSSNFNFYTMPVLYHAIGRKDPRFPIGPVKYYASAKARGKITLKELAKKIAATSSLSAGDTYGVLTQMQDQVSELLGEGFIVDIGLGTFVITLDSKGENAPLEVNDDSIEGNRLNFRPNKEMKDDLNTIEYEKEQE